VGRCWSIPLAGVAANRYLARVVDSSDSEAAVVALGIADGPGAAAVAPAQVAALGSAGAAVALRSGLFQRRPRSGAAAPEAAAPQRLAPHGLQEAWGEDPAGPVPAPAAAPAPAPAAAARARRGGSGAAAHGAAAPQRLAPPSVQEALGGGPAEPVTAPAAAPAPAPAAVARAGRGRYGGGRQGLLAAAQARAAAVRARPGGGYRACSICGYARWVPLWGSRQLKCLSGLKGPWRCPNAGTGLRLSSWHRQRAVQERERGASSRQVVAGAAAVRAPPGPAFFE
ncbi:unnamed protein product, partial [Prorocentrum cordatum]